MKTTTRSQARQFHDPPCLVPMLCAALFASAISARAVDIVWTNTADSNWNTAANWSPIVVPDSTDTVLITNAGSYTVTVNVSPTIAGLTLGGDSGIGERHLDAQRPRQHRHQRRVQLLRRHFRRHQRPDRQRHRELERGVL